MDNITHGLIGLTVNSLLKEKDRTTFWVALVSSEIPDIDILYRLKSSTDYLINHRGVTHSLPGIVLTALAITLAAGLFSQKADRKKIFLLAIFCLSLHVLFDLFTAWGTQVLFPFSMKWWYTDFVPIVDPVMIIILGAALLAGRVLGRPRLLAAAGSALIIAFLLFRLGCHGHVVNQYQSLYPRARVSAMAGFSPLDWKVVVEEKERLLSGTVKLAGSTDSTGQLKPTPVHGFQKDRYMSDPYFAGTVNFFRYPLFDIKSTANGDTLIIRDFYYSFRLVEFPLDNLGNIAGKPLSERN
jgi:inner membrane protein